MEWKRSFHKHVRSQTEFGKEGTMNRSTPGQKTSEVFKTSEVWNISYTVVFPTKPSFPRLVRTLALPFSNLKWESETPSGRIFLKFIIASSIGPEARSQLASQSIVHLGQRPQRIAPWEGIPRAISNNQLYFICLCAPVANNSV